MDRAIAITAGDSRSIPFGTIEMLESKMPFFLQTKFFLLQVMNELYSISNVSLSGIAHFYIGSILEGDRSSDGVSRKTSIQYQNLFCY
jgi:hypothetical protein